MNDDIFRKKSIDNMDSPENLDSFLRITNPPIWFAIIGVIILLIGTVIWGCMAKLEVKLDGVVVSKAGKAVCYVSELDIASISAETEVIVNGNRYTVNSVSGQAFEAGEVLNDYSMNLGGFSRGEYVYELGLDASINDGNYASKLVVESISPISFIFSSTN